MIDESTSNGVNKVKISISEQLVLKAQKILEEHGQIDGIITIPSSGNEVAAVLTRNPKEVISLYSFEYEGVTYHLGLPRED